VSADPRPDPGVDPTTTSGIPSPQLRFAGAVVLSKREVFEALEACAAAERGLLRAGRPVEAAGVAALFELLEDRVTLEFEVPPRTRATGN
jgi:hypothetical protein